MSLSSINPIFEGASAILYHFITPERFCDIIKTNQFTPSAAEYNINGDGVNFMSFSRTGSFRHGWPICMQSECGAGSEWGIVRLTIDGSMFNTHPNFKDANGIQSSIKVNPFDWAYHEHTKTGHRIKDTYDISIDADNGKEWMMASDDSMYGALPFNPGDYNYELEDRYAQPYSQAEDRLLTRAKHIPYADKYIKRVDIILMQIPNEEDYSDYQERQEEREAFYKAINNSRFKNITHLYDSVWSLEHGQEIPKEELLGNTSEVKPLYEYVCHLKGHRNSKGELAEWVIKSHETGKILSSHKSEKKAKEHLQQMHIFKESVDSMSYKLLGETTNGTDMDKRIEIFMEGVSQLGLTKNQMEAVGEITKVCMEGMEDGDFGGADFGAPPDLGGPSPERDAMEEYQLDQVYNELWKLGVPTDTINARGRENDFSFKTMYQLLKEVCNWKGVPVPEIMGAEDYKTSVSDLGGDGVEEEPAEF